MNLGVGIAAGTLLGCFAGSWYTSRYGEGPDLIVNVPGFAIIGAILGAGIGAAL